MVDINLVMVDIKMINGGYKKYISKYIFLKHQNQFLHYILRNNIFLYTTFFSIQHYVKQYFFSITIFFTCSYTILCIYDIFCLRYYVPVPFMADLSVAAVTNNFKRPLFSCQSLTH